MKVTREQLQSIEWSGPLRVLETERTCVVCRRSKLEGHAPDCWIAAALASAPSAPPPDPPGLAVVVGEFQRAHANYRRAKHEDVGQEDAWARRKAARAAVLAYDLTAPASPQAEGASGGKFDAATWRQAAVYMRNRQKYFDEGEDARSAFLESADDFDRFAVEAAPAPPTSE